MKKILKDVKSHYGNLKPINVFVEVEAKGEYWVIPYKTLVRINRDGSRDYYDRVQGEIEQD